MSTDKPLKISIAMATYNGGKYLQEQLDSFLAQTRLPDELVITDDCSTDNTLEIIQAFAVKAPFEVRWEQHEKNLGYTDNFNQALMKTTGDLVFLSDQDDVWFPEKLERMERYALDDPKALVVMNDAALTDGELNDTGLTKQGQIASAGMTDSSFVMGCCAVVRRELLNLCLPIPAGFKGHDSWIVGIAEGIERKLVIGEVLQWYRRHDENESQFIVNRVTKVTRLTLIYHNLLRILYSSGYNVEIGTEYIQINLIYSAVLNSISKTKNQDLRVSLINYSKKLNYRIKLLSERKKITSQRRCYRIISIYSLYTLKDSEGIYGLRLALKDLLLR